MTRHWAQSAAERFVPPMVPPSDEEVEAMLPVTNLIRRAHGEREVSLSEAIEDAGALDAVEVAELTAQARLISAEQERRLRALAPEWSDEVPR
jgi:hypothetical protein